MVCLGLIAGEKSFRPTSGSRYFPVPRFIRHRDMPPHLCTDRGQSLQA